jgi:hypothetical protein
MIHGLIMQWCKFSDFLKIFYDVLSTAHGMLARLRARVWLR